MNLWMYSSEEGQENESMDEDLCLEIFSKKPVFTFIPAHSDDAEVCYDSFIERFSPYAAINFRMLDPEGRVTKADIRSLKSSDLIYLSGGNTFHFLKNLRVSGLLETIRNFAKAGGLLAGHSAGAILMTPHIRTAAIPDFDRDHNNVGIKNILAMRLCRFEFFPHYEDIPEYSEVLEFASVNGTLPIYSVEDGCGIVVNEKGLRFYGDAWVFYRGAKVKISVY